MFHPILTMNMYLVPHYLCLYLYLTPAMPPISVATL